MQLLALETNIEVLKRRFLSAEEKEIATVRFHGFRFFMLFLRDIVYTLIIVGVAWALEFAGVPPLWINATAIIVWFLFVFVPLLKAFLDWRFDFLLITTDKVVIVDQSSIYHQKVTPINLENFASVTAETQYGNIFPFGILHFNLKEGHGRGISLRFIPHAHDVSSIISDIIIQFQRRIDFRRHSQLHST